MKLKKTHNSRESGEITWKQRPFLSPYLFHKNAFVINLYDCQCRYCCCYLFVVLPFFRAAVNYDILLDISTELLLLVVFLMGFSYKKKATKCMNESATIGEQALFTFLSCVD